MPAIMVFMLHPKESLQIALSKPIQANVFFHNSRFDVLRISQHVREPEKKSNDRDLENIDAIKKNYFNI